MAVYRYPSRGALRLPVARLLANSRLCVNLAFQMARLLLLGVNVATTFCIAMIHSGIHVLTLFCIHVYV